MFKKTLVFFLLVNLSPGFQEFAKILPINKVMALGIGEFISSCLDGQHIKQYGLDAQGKLFAIAGSGKKLIARISHPERFAGLQGSVKPCTILGNRVFFFGKGLVSVQLTPPYEMRDYFSGKDAGMYGGFVLKNLENFMISELFLENGSLLVSAEVFAEPSHSAWILIEDRKPWRRSQWFSTPHHGAVFYSAVQGAFFVHHLVVDDPDSIYFQKVSLKDFSTHLVRIPIGLPRPNCQLVIDDNQPRRPRMSNGTDQGYERAEQFRVTRKDSCGEYSQVFDWLGKSKNK